MRRCISADPAAFATQPHRHPEILNRQYLPSLAAFRYFSLACPVSTSAILCG